MDPLTNLPPSFNSDGSLPQNTGALSPPPPVVTPVYQAPTVPLNQPPTALQPIPPVPEATASGTPPQMIGAMQVPPPVQSQSSRWKKVVLILVLLSLTSGAAYGMYVYKDTIKAMLPYFGDDVVLTEDNFTSSLMNSFKTINAVEYTFSANISIKDREKDTVSMDSKLGPALEKLESYKNDYNKSQIITELLSALQYLNYGYSNSKAPKDLTELKKKYTETYSRYSSEEVNNSNNQIIDSSIAYRVTNGGSDYELTVTFETDEAVNAIKDQSASRSYSYNTASTSNSTTTRYEGKRVVFTKGSNSYLYVPREMKRPLLSQLGYYLKDLPQEFSVEGTSTILSKLVDGQLPEMKTGITAEGNFSDLTYNLSLDTILKDKVFYYHIKNFPALGLFGSLSTLKGKWVKVEMDKEVSTSSRNDTDMVGQLSLGVQEGLEKNKETTKKVMEAFARSADTSKLITFTFPPTHEKLGNESVTKYQFFVKRESLPVFLSALEQESAADPEIQKAFIEYKKEISAMIDSPDFVETYDYSKANIFLTMWTRKDGMPIQTQMRLRIIPSIESKNLKDKQIELILTMNLSKINETINIETPKDAKTYTEIMGTSTSRGFFD